MRVLISGAGIAGPTLAFWLDRFDIAVSLVESAPAPRRGGYIIDFWGAGFGVAEEMGLLPRLKEVGYSLREVRLVNTSGERVGGFDARVFSRLTNGRYVSIPRSALALTLFDALPQRVHRIFDDEVVAVAPRRDGLDVAFREAAPDRYDLIIGAGGLHSRVRSLSFGAEDSFACYLGYKVGAFEVSNYQPRDTLIYVSYAAPGLQAARFSLRDGRTQFLLVTADDEPNLPKEKSDQRAYLHRHFDHAGWECPQIMQAMDQADELYLDNASQIRMPAWSQGRVCLIGDAAACPSLLAGEGASLAMAEAYVLAGELHRAAGDYERAFAAYERQLRPLIERKQRAARRFAASFAPKTRLGINVRNLATKAMAIPLVAELALGGSVRDNFELPRYSAA